MNFRTSRRTSYNLSTATKDSDAIERVPVFAFVGPVCIFYCYCHNVSLLNLIFDYIKDKVLHKSC